MTTNPPDLPEPQPVRAASPNGLDLVRVEIGNMLTLVDQLRAEIESDRLAYERAATELIARTEERAALIRAEAEAYAADVRRSADDYSSSKRSDVVGLRTSGVAANKLIARAEADARARGDEILSDATERLSALIDAQLDARNNLIKVVNGIEDTLGASADAPSPQQTTQS